MKQTKAEPPARPFLLSIIAFAGIFARRDKETATMRATRIFATMVACVLAGSLMAADLTENDWMTNLTKAKAQAQADKKDLIVVVGPKAGNASKVKMILSKEEFSGEASKTHLFVFVDPSDTENDASLVSFLATIDADASSIGVYFTDTDLKVFGAIDGFHDAKPSQYLNAAQVFDDTKAIRDQMQAAADKLTGVERAKVLHAMLGILSSRAYVMGGGATMGYKDTIDEVCQIDSKNENHLLVAWTMLAAYRDSRLKVSTKDYDGAYKALEAFISNPLFVGETEFLQQALWLKAGVSFYAKDRERFLSSLEQCIQIAPESEIGKLAAETKLKFLISEQEQKNQQAHPAPAPVPQPATPGTQGK